MKVWKDRSELNEDDLKHLEIVQTIDELEALGPKIFLGFVIFWILLAAATALWVYLYLIPTVQGWF